MRVRGAKTLCEYSQLTPLEPSIFLSKSVASQQFVFGTDQKHMNSWYAHDCERLHEWLEAGMSPNTTVDVSSWSVNRLTLRTTLTGTLLKWSCEVNCERCYELLRFYGANYRIISDLNLERRETEQLGYPITLDSFHPFQNKFQAERIKHHGFPQTEIRIAYSQVLSTYLDDLWNLKLSPNYRLEIPSCLPSKSAFPISFDYSRIGWDIHQEVLLACCPNFFTNLPATNKFLCSLDAPGTSMPIFIEYLYTHKHSLVTRPVSLDVVFEVWRIALFFGLLHFQSMLATYCSEWLVSHQDISTYINELTTAATKQSFPEEDVKMVLWNHIDQCAQVEQNKFELFRFPSISVEWMLTKSVKLATIAPTPITLRWRNIWSAAPDLTLMVSNESETLEIPAHQALLVISIPYFRSMISGPWKENAFDPSASTLTLAHSTNLHPSTFNALLQYFYTGLLQCTPIEAFRLLYQLSFYGIESNTHLKHQIMTLLNSFASSLTLENCMDAFEGITVFNLFPTYEKILFAYLNSVFPSLSSTTANKVAMVKVFVQTQSLLELKKAVLEGKIEKEVLQQALEEMKIVH